jgi:hypothetical protein
MLPLVRALAAGREADAPLFVKSSGHRLHASAFKRTLAWGTVGEGRRTHDLPSGPRWCLKHTNPRPNETSTKEDMPQ